MALVRCRECGKEVSNAATACPSCGAPVPKGMSRATILFLVVAGFLGLSYINAAFRSPTPGKSADAPRASAVQDMPVVDYDKAMAEKKLERAGSFAKDRSKIIASMKRLNSSGRFDEASKLGNEYFDVDDADLQQQIAVAEKKISERVAMKARTDAIKARAAAKKEGVYIGMTQAQVIASSWGRPQGVNRTTTVLGTHEQWVYGIHSYLYFEEGILTSIQN